MPGQDGVGFDNAGHLRQRLLPELYADLGEGLTFPITQPDTPLELLTQDAILCDQVLVP